MASSSRLRSRQNKLGNNVSKQGGQAKGLGQGQGQGQGQEPSLLKGGFSQIPGSMNSKYLICLSMTMNIILLTSLVYQKKNQPKRLRDEGKSLVNLNQIHLPVSPDPVCAGEGEDLEKHVAEAAVAQVALSLSFSSWCSGHGHWVTKRSRNSTPFSAESQTSSECKCHACYSGHNCSTPVSNCVINLDHGDPTMFESFWIKNGQKSTTVILGWQVMSYFADVDNICWFLEPELAKEIRYLHSLVGNAVTKGRHLVVGTGSTQLFQAALYALSGSNRFKPADVVSAAPYYSSYPVVTDYLKSEMYRWAGDAFKYRQTSDEDYYIELVTSPNNPDGFTREAVVNGSGPVVYDHAYYWPHYTPIIAPADGDVMLFTVSKSTGHAGSRIGWAIVKDAQVAKRMTKYIELNTIGVSKDSQLRASQILHSVSSSYTSEMKDECETDSCAVHEDRFFHHGSSLMAERWKRLRDVVSLNHRFSLPTFEPAFCNFFGRYTTPQPAFAWLKCEGGREGKNEEVEDCEKLLRSNGIITRSGRHFGAPQSYVRLSILDRSHTFDLLIRRLSTIH